MMNTIAHSYNTTTTNSEMEEIEKVMKELLEQKEQLLTILCEQQNAVEQTTMYQSSLVSPIEANALWQQTNSFIQQLRNGVNNEIYQIDEQIKTLKNQLNTLLANNNNIQGLPSVSNMSNVSSISNMSIPSVPMTECDSIDVNPANLPSISNTSSASSILSSPNPTDTDSSSSDGSDGGNNNIDIKTGDNNEHVQPHSWDDIDQIEEFKFDSNGVINQFNGGMKRKVIKGKRSIKGLKSGKLGKSKSKQSQVNNILNANASEYNGNGDYTGNADGSINENDNGGYTYRMDELCCIDNLSATYDCLISLILTNSGLNSKERNDSISKRFGRLAEKIGFVNELIKTKMNTDGKDSQLDTIPEE